MRKRTHVREYYRRHHGTSDTGGEVSEHNRGYEAGEGLKSASKQAGFSEIYNEARKAYADTYLPFNEAAKIRNLSWEGTPFLHPEDARSILKLIGNYNNFDPDAVSEYLINMANVSVKIGREYSPVIYVQGDDLDELASDAKDQLTADEINFVTEQHVYPSEAESRDVPAEEYGKWLEEHTKIIKFDRPTLRLWWD